MLFNSVTIHKKVCHGNVKNFVKMFKTAKNYYLVYEHCSGGNLYDKVTLCRLTES
jgi:serine/threonine protein kinase